MAQHYPSFLLEEETNELLHDFQEAAAPYDPERRNDPLILFIDFVKEEKGSYFTKLLQKRMITKGLPKVNHATIFDIRGPDVLMTETIALLNIYMMTLLLNLENIRIP